MKKLKKLLANRLYLSVVGLVVVTLIGTVHMIGNVLKQPITGSLPMITVNLERTGGLFVGSPASYRGARIGTIRDIGISDGGQVQAEVELREGVEVPKQTKAFVRSLSPVGEQYLDFQPRTDEGPFLEDGDVVTATATDVPVSIASAAEEVGGLLDAIDRRDLRVVLHELSIAMNGTGDDLETSLDSLNVLTTELNSAWPETDRLLTNGARVGEVFARHRGDLANFSQSAKQLAAFLREFDPKFRKILKEVPADFGTLDTLMVDLQQTLPPVLKALIRVGDLAYDREPHLRELTRVLGPSVGRFAAAFRDGWLHVDLQLNGQAQCQYGNGPRDARAARQTLSTGGHCSMGDDVWRGAEHAPPPLGR